MVSDRSGRNRSVKKWRIIPGALLITLRAPRQLVITAFLFGGITSSICTILVQVEQGRLGLTAVFLCSVLTDYIDRLISLVFIFYLLSIIPEYLYREE